MIKALLSVKALLALLVAYYNSQVPPYMRHESELETNDRIELIVASIDRACDEHPLDGWSHEACVALGVTAAKWESGFLPSVHSGEKRGPSGEVCLFQIHPGAVAGDPAYRVTHEEWLTLPGTSAEATQACANAGIKTLAWHIHRCHFNNEDRYSAALVFAEYHQPTQTCAAMPSRMSFMRATDYAKTLKTIRRTERADRAESEDR